MPLGECLVRVWLPPFSVPTETTPKKSCSSCVTRCPPPSSCHTVCLQFSAKMPQCTVCKMSTVTVRGKVEQRQEASAGHSVHKDNDPQQQSRPFCWDETNFGQFRFGHPDLSILANPFLAILVFARPILAKTKFGQPNFGQSNFGQSMDRCVCVMVGPKGGAQKVRPRTGGPKK